MNSVSTYWGSAVNWESWPTRVLGSSGLSVHLTVELISTLMRWELDHFHSEEVRTCLRSCGGCCCGSLSSDSFGCLLEKSWWGFLRTKAALHAALFCDCAHRDPDTAPSLGEWQFQLPRVLHGGLVEVTGIKLLQSGACHQPGRNGGSYIIHSQFPDEETKPKEVTE